MHSRCYRIGLSMTFLGFSPPGDYSSESRKELQKLVDFSIEHPEKVEFRSALSLKHALVAPGSTNMKGRY